MTNHIHLLATPSDIQGITRMMQYIGRHYVPYINHTYGGTGSIWEGRYIANLVQDDRCLSTCIRYIELNLVRADMVASPVIKRSIQDSRLGPIMVSHGYFGCEQFSL
jgi:putative transposase